MHLIYTISSQLSVLLPEHLYELENKKPGRPHILVCKKRWLVVFVFSISTGLSMITVIFGPNARQYQSDHVFQTPVSDRILFFNKRISR